MSEIEQLQQELEDLRALPTNRAANAFDQMMARLVEESRELRAMLIPEIRVEAPAVTVNPQALPPDVIVNVPDQTEAITLLASLVTSLIDLVAAKEFSVTVNVPENPVALTFSDKPDPAKRITIKRNKSGLIESALVEEE